MDADYSEEVDRVLRGGSFNRAAAYLRAAIRYGGRPANRIINFGFRPSRTYP
jgi:formylglycine-generating enzyme required for sulfatase activity